jgi:hypothetical protein
VIEMKKTTLYIEDDLFRKIKEKTVRTPDATITGIVNESLRKYFEGPGGTTARFKHLKKAFGTSEAFHKIADPVAHQKKLRADWD